jgi:hypothetical protein
VKVFVVIHWPSPFGSCRLFKVFPSLVIVLVSHICGYRADFQHSSGLTFSTCFVKVVSWARRKLVVICFWDNHCVHSYPVHVIGSLFLTIIEYFTGKGGETGVGCEQ